jgi:acetylornithine deacetylase/succinyl-diaminopimelate desuccinylase-like protein
MTTTERVLARLEAGFEAAQARWLDWLRIPSISAQPAHAADCRAAAEFARRELQATGFTAALHETKGQPVVLAHHPGPSSQAPHLLYYGHYDVQPPEPLELWTSPPFEPAIVDGPHGKRVVARGAVDDKGQVAMWLGALRAWAEETGSLPVRATVLIEGEEEIGSPSLEPFLAAHREELAADIAVISDTSQWDIDTPAITTRLRGLVYTEIRIKAASRDLHSGVYGGSAQNALNLLTRVLGALHDANGRIAIPGFYDGVAEMPPALAAEWAALGFDEGRFLAEIGLRTPAGEAGRSALERLWARPACDINGIWGGYAGPGSKTVIPAEAGAKVSFRLVPGQDPAHVLTQFRRFLQARMPEGVALEMEVLGAPGRGIEVPADSRFVQAARAALTEEFGHPAVLIGSGASIPVVESFKRLLGLDCLLMGFGLDDDRLHSPNEKFEVRCFRHGLRAHARLLGRLGLGA